MSEQLNINNKEGRIQYVHKIKVQSNEICLSKLSLGVRNTDDDSDSEFHKYALNQEADSHTIDQGFKKIKHSYVCCKAIVRVSTATKVGIKAILVWWKGGGVQGLVESLTCQLSNSF